ncbi:hypothetical protein MW887_007553 [Aspergillus wentii]|nr:hypothetical protein MW887_007553 [Aspergillus wentii]
MLRWFSRCLPGFSIIALLLLLLLTFTDAASLSPWKDFFPPSTDKPSGDKPSPINIGQKIFMIYTILIHINGFGFTVRLSWSLFNVTKETKLALKRRIWQTSRTPSEADGGDYVDSPSTPTQKFPDPAVFKMPYSSVDSIDELEEVVHAIILPNYGEDIGTLKTTLDVLASHPRASTQYEIYLAMEQKESGAAEKAAKLILAFEKSFLQIRSTFHPANLQGEIAGKSSNVAFAARHIVEVHRADLNTGACNVIITVIDADTHLWQDYFTEIRRLHYIHTTEADRTVYCCPIIFDRNSNESPILVRCADLLWGFAGLSTMYPGAPISIPTSVYSLPLSLAEKVGGWDSDPTAIGEDMHMLLKCYFETAGNVVSRNIFIPASQCNVSSDTGRGWRRTLDTCFARYRQALRHMWGALDSGFAARRTMSYLRLHSRCLFLRPRHFALLHLMWEAHFLPCHLMILMVFSLIYSLMTPPELLHPSMTWTFWFTGLLRTSSFIWMNVCLALYERWYTVCLQSRRKDMLQANLTDTGFSQRTWWHTTHLLERICFPIAGTIFGGIPTIHAVFSHFWTDRLVYRVSKKPDFAMVGSMA